MDQIDEARQRLEAAAGFGDLMAASWTAFDVLSAVSLRCQRQSHELFAAFAFAAAAAVQGRTILTAATAQAARLPDLAAATGPPTGDLHQAADALGELAGMLQRRLAAAARQAGDTPDGQDCAEAAYQALTVHRLLAAAP